MRTDSRQRKVVCVCTGLIAYLLFLRTTAPTISAADSGELISVAWLLGVAHQPGYPLFSLLGKTFATLVPFGGVAFRMNLLSACLGAGTCLILAVTMIRHLRVNTFMAAVITLLMATSRPFWGIAIITEVYALNIFLLSLLAMVLLNQTFSIRKKLLSAGFIWGLSLTAHPTSILLVPALAVIPLGKSRRFSSRDSILAILCFFLGLSAFLYLPLRAIQHTEINWGLTYNVHNFLIHTCKKFAVNVFETAPWKTPKSPTMVFKTLGLSIWALIVASPFPVIILASIALIRRWRLNWRAALPWLLAIVPPFGAIAFSFDFHKEAVIIDYGSKFFLPVFLLMTLLTAEVLAKRRYFRQVALLILLVCSVLINGSYCNLRTFNIYYDYGKNIFKSLPHHAAIFLDGDHQVFTTAFLRLVHGFRPDVTLIDQKGNMFQYFYDRGKLTIKSRNESEAAFIAAADRPVFYSERHIPFYVQGYRLEQEGIIFRTLKTTDQPRANRGNITLRYQMRLPANLNRIDCVTRILLARYLTFLGNYHTSTDSIDKARQYHLKCLDLKYRTSVVLTNLSVTYLKSGERLEAATYLRQAIQAADPPLEDPYLRLARLLYEEGKMKKTVDVLFESLKKFPKSAALNLLIGTVYAYHEPDPEKAVYHWQNYLQYEHSKRGRPGAERDTVKSEIKRLEKQLRE